jgi:hypothetical protein
VGVLGNLMTALQEFSDRRGEVGSALQGAERMHEQRGADALAIEDIQDAAGSVPHVRTLEPFRMEREAAQDISHDADSR